MEFKNAFVPAVWITASCLPMTCFCDEPPKPPRSGLVLWLDPSEESTATIDSSRRVSKLADQSEAHHDAKPSSTESMPELARISKGRPMLRFTGKESLTIDPIRTAPGGVTVFAVYLRATGKQSPGPDPSLVASISDSSSSSSALPNFRIAAPTAKDPWRMISTISIENVPIGPIFIGRDYSGYIGDVLVYDRTFTNESDRQKVFDYLKKKWNAEFPITGWLRDTALEPKPERPRPDLPLSDQKDTGKWKLDPKFSDEFQGTRIDLNRYALSSSFKGWDGRKPGVFLPENVRLQDGTLRMKMDKSTPEQLKAHPGFSYTTGYFRTTERTAYGFYEIEAKPAYSAFNCAFWFADTGDPKNQAEIDIFEIATHSKKCPNHYFMTPHVWNDDGDNFHWGSCVPYRPPWNMADDFHVYGFEWGKDWLRWYIDGTLVRAVKNTNWHRAMYLTIDAEPMVEWFGPIDDKDLPAEHIFRHLKVWRQSESSPAEAGQILSK